MKKILLIDDSATVRRQVGVALAAAGYRTIEAEDGQQAIRILKSEGDIAMAIADVNMPVMNGIDMLKKLRELNLAPTLPILMLTTEGQPELIEQARKYGAKGWIIKPFKPDMLVATVRKLAGAP